MKKLIVTQYKDTENVNESGTIRSKEGSKRASIYLTKTTLVNKGGALWNALPEDTKNSENLEVFKRKYRGHE